MATPSKAGPSAFFALFDVFPLLAFPVLFLNLMVFTGWGGDLKAWLASEVFTITGLSGDTWSLSPGDIIIVIGVVILFFEIIKSTRTDTISLINHAIAALAFVLFLLEFLIVKGFMNSTFFILMMMQLVDVIAGYTVTVVAAKRDFGSSGGIIGTN